MNANTPRGKTLFTIPSLMSPAECTALIAMTEGRGYSAAPITTSRGFVMAPEVRNNTRVMFDDVALAAALWSRIEASVERRPGFVPVGLNERIRFYRYDPGQAFRWHFDGSFVRNAEERSFLTFMVYLNEGFGGGETELEEEAVRPRTGLGVVFDHGLRHQGAAVTHGRKYVLRSDVMFRRVRQSSSSSSSSSSVDPEENQLGCSLPSISR